MKSFFLVTLLWPAFSYAQYEVLSKVAGNKVTVITHWTDGYVKKASGERMEGKIQLKVVNNDTVEIRIKNSGKEKLELPRAQVKSFGRRIDPNAHHSNNPRFNFQPGYVILANGNKLEGKVRTNNMVPNGKQITFPDIIEYVNAQNDLRIFNSFQAQGTVFSIDNVEIVYERYKGNFLEQLVKGKLIVLPNPAPTTQAEIATDISRAIDSAITQSPSNTVVYKNEYLVHSENSKDYTTVTPINYESWAKQLIASCSAFSLLDPRSRNEFTHWSRFMDAVKFYNERCK